MPETSLSAAAADELQCIQEQSRSEEPRLEMVSKQSCGVFPTEVSDGTVIAIRQLTERVKSLEDDILDLRAIMNTQCVELSRLARAIRKVFNVTVT